MIPALLLWVAMGQQPEKITCAGSTDGHCIPIDPPITIRVPAVEHKPMVIAGDGVELKAQPNGDVIAQKSKPLKCGKGEHVEVSVIDKVPHGYCFPDQDYGQRIDALHCDKYEFVVGSHERCFWEGADGKCKKFITIPDQCAPILHTVTEKEWQELMEWKAWVDHLRKEQCPSLSWIGGKCLPYCDEMPNSTGSCAHRNKPESRTIEER